MVVASRLSNGLSVFHAKRRDAIGRREGRESSGVAVTDRAAPSPDGVTDPIARSGSRARSRDPGPASPPARMAGIPHRNPESRNRSNCRTATNLQ